ncbi:hypothetical protein GRJ2_002932700 [Grus japonensis]|uniref:Peptidase A2 domain-containing protein n=1 Tax=Grus japonensis TaxID=30415 RepID=A0ABC9Y400_GRUJA
MSDPWAYKAVVDTSAQCTLMPLSHDKAEPICISGVTGGSQQLTVMESEVSLTGNDWQKHPIVTGPEAPCMRGIDCLWRGYFKDIKGITMDFWTLETEEIKQLSILPSLSEHPCVVRLLTVEEQVPIGTTMVHLQYVDDIIIWGNTAEEVSEKGKKIVQILWKASFAINRSKVTGPAQA